MPTPRARLTLLAATLVLASCRPNQPAAPRPAVSSTPIEVLALVNGVPIRRSQLEASLLANGAQLPGTAQEKTEAVLEQLIATELMAQEAAARGIVVSDSEVQESAGHEPIPERMLGEARRQMAVQKLLTRDVFPGLPALDEKAMRAWYDANPRQFTEPDAERVAQILVRQRAGARQKIEAALAEAKAGSDFAALARAQSEDPPSRERGGDVGWLTAGVSEHDWPPEFLAAAAALQNKGDLSGVVESPLGLHVLKLLDKRPARLVPFDDRVKAEIRAILQEKQEGEAVAEFAATLRKKARVEFPGPP